jgi:multiple sugar transport system substrate-binding protein
VDHVGLSDIPNHAAEESKTQHGHDLFAHVYPLPAYEDEVVDHRDNRLMLAGAGSLVLNAISIPRTAENTKLPVGERIWLARAAQGPVRRLAPDLIQTYVIWKFAENIDGAKQCLVNYIGHFRQAFLASALYNLPCFPQTVPDLEQLCTRDAQATPPEKYKILAEALTWTTHLGYPGVHERGD